MEILAMSKGHIYWNATLSFAKNCSCKAGSYLAELMEKNQFLDWERVFVACENNEIMGFCTLTEKDELPNTYDFSPFIGFVYVDEKYRGNRISELLIYACTCYARELGFENIYIMSGEIGFYEKYGFKKLGDYETIFGSVDQLFVKAVN